MALCGNKTFLVGGHTNAAETLVGAGPLDHPVCLLRSVEELVPRRAQKTFLSITLFFAQKAIVLYWKKPEALSLAFWKGMVNKSLPFYKATYATRGCQCKFDKVWQGWLVDLSIVG